MRIASYTLALVLIAGGAYATGPYEVAAEDSQAQAEGIAEIGSEPEVPVDTKAAAAPEAPEAVSAPPPAANAENVIRAIVATEIAEREPVDTVDTLNNDQTQVFFFTELRGLEGRTVTHRWEFGGQVMAEVPLTIGAARWRTYSSKQLDPNWLGDWKVSILDESGQVLAAGTFVYAKAPPPETQPQTEIEPSTPVAPAN